MSRRNILGATSAVAAAAVMPSMAFGQTKTAPPGITIVIPITAIGASREAFIEGMQAIAAAVRSMTGRPHDD